jgi:hypothetical protein
MLQPWSVIKRHAMIPALQITEIFHVDTDILEILDNTTTTKEMARTLSSGGNAYFISQEE